MKTTARFFLALMAFNAPVVSAQTQDLASLQKLGEEFLKAQHTDQSGELQISIGKIDPRSKLPACQTPEVFIPQNGKILGKITLGFRCLTPKQWSIYVPATVQLTGNYFVTTSALTQGQVISANDIKKVSGDLGTLPVGTITDENQIVGHTVQFGVSAGTVIKLQNLKKSFVIQQGQSIKIVATGNQFKISADGLAMNNAAEGQIVKAKTGSGHLISGIAKLGGFIEVQY